MPESSPKFELWCEIDDLKPGDFDPENDVCDIVVSLPTGERYGLKVWTFGYLATRRAADVASGKHLRGAYLLPPDLLVERLDRALIRKVVADMIASDELDWDFADLVGEE